WRTYASVAGRFVFYNNSTFDGNDPAANDADDAIAPDKQALLPGGTGGFANVTSYSRGINGIGVDVAGIPADVALPWADVSFKLGNGGDVSAWADAPEPTSLIVRRGAGAGGSDRVMLTFADNAIRNTWLQVTVLANPRTGLRTPDAVYFGNLVGDAGERPRLDGRFSAITVGARDLFATRRGYTTSVFADLSNTNDHNRDGKVNALDLALARLNFFRTLAPFAPGATA